MEERGKGSGGEEEGSKERYERITSMVAGTRWAPTEPSKPEEGGPTCLGSTCFSLYGCPAGSSLVQTTHLVSGKPAFEPRPNAKASVLSRTAASHQPACVVCVKWHGCGCRLGAPESIRTDGQAGCWGPGVRSLHPCQPGVKASFGWGVKH